MPRDYVGVCAGSRSVGRPRKIWIDTVKEFLRKRGLDIKQARRMLQDMSEWRRFVVCCHSYKKLLKDGIPSVAEPTT